AYGSEVWGTDIDPRSARVAAESGVQFVADVAAVEDGYFDFINADQVFEHLADPVGVIRVLAAKLRRGGHLKTSTPADRRIEAKLARLNSGGYSLQLFKRDFHALSPLSHINLFSATSLGALAAAARLESFRVPLQMCYAVMTGFHSARQLNRNLYNPLKRYSARGTWQFFRKP
ncbi:MAG: class I SAM-dependent methyltransferase, partial [Verrucomicrobiota bacterium]|nr:class I SAM-dependent methyltransferase [Verrucomicrobiota bacterium]